MNKYRHYVVGCVVLILLLVDSGPNVNAKKVITEVDVKDVDMTKVETHGITHCEMKPLVCSAICGNASPICEPGGNCMCRKLPHQVGPNCKDPSLSGVCGPNCTVPLRTNGNLEAKRCHAGLCSSSIINRPLVCHWKKLKICACFPQEE